MANNFYKCGCVVSYQTKRAQQVVSGVIFCEAHRPLNAVQDALSIATTVMDKVADRTEQLPPLPLPKRSYNNYLRS